MSSKDNDEEHATHSGKDNIELMINNKEDRIIDKLFQSLLSRYQIGLQKSMKSSDVISDCVNFLQYKCHGINLNVTDHVQILLIG